ncbi:unnamed protein product [Vicia faba]|uniref:Uncharacterized protein n=1 Tax=Vicia faba TaxID=3906 RepID=A0AAV0ZGM2_VICFA|nr:unnamed protein product [Vicia faba]
MKVVGKNNQVIHLFIAFIHQSSIQLQIFVFVQGHNRANLQAMLMLYKKTSYNSQRKLQEVTIFSKLHKSFQFTTRISSVISRRHWFSNPINEDLFISSCCCLHYRTADLQDSFSSLPFAFIEAMALCSRNLQNQSRKATLFKEKASITVKKHNF